MYLFGINLTYLKNYVILSLAKSFVSRKVAAVVDGSPDSLAAVSLLLGNLFKHDVDGNENVI